MNSTSKFVVTFGVLLITFKVYKTLKKKKTKNNKNENLTYKNKYLPKIGTVIGHVSSLHIYPVKSCKEITIKTAKMDINGFLNDRIITAVNPKLIPITQRMMPKLALIKVEIISNNNHNNIVLSLPNEYKFEKFNMDTQLIQKSSTSRIKTIDLHGVKAQCVDCGDDAAKWLNNALSILTNKIKKNNRFFMILNDEKRKVGSSLCKYYMDDVKTYDSTRLSDISPITFVSTASLNELNKKIGINKSVPINRFRSNIVFRAINDNYAFLEDHITMLQIGDVKLRTISPSFRCIIPSVDQEKGETEFFKSYKTCEPVNTLKKTRSTLRYGFTGILPTDMGGCKGMAPLFGIYLGFITPDNADIENKVINEGDKVIVLKYKKNSNGFFNQLLMKIERYFGFYTLE